MDDLFNNRLLTADPKEHIRRAKILLDFNNDSLLLYSALELRLAIEKIMELLNEYKNQGSYEIEFDSTDLGSGVYIYRIKIDEFIQTRKMLLIK